MRQKTLFSKKSEFFYVLRHMSIKRIQTSIIHIPPCSQEIIDNENPIFLHFFEDAKWGCLDAMVKIISKFVFSVHIL
jgi:hypothetical protein